MRALTMMIYQQIPVPKRKMSLYHAMPSHLHPPLPRTLFPILYDLDSRDTLGIKGEIQLDATRPEGRYFVGLDLSSGISMHATGLDFNIFR